MSLNKMLLVLLLLVPAFAYYNTTTFWSYPQDNKQITVTFILEKPMNVTIRIYKEGLLVYERQVSQDTSVNLEEGAYIVEITYEDGSTYVVPEAYYDSDRTIIIPARVPEETPKPPIPLKTTIAIILFVFAIMIYLASK